MASKICILDDDSAFLQKIEAELDGYAVTACPDAETFFESFAPRSFDLIVLDMRLNTGKEGLEVLKEIQRLDPYQATVVATAYADTATYVEALQAGALLYVDKNRYHPEDLASLFDAVIQQGRLRRDFASAIRMLERMYPTELIGTTEGMRELRDQIAQARFADNGVIIIEGESGTGRELVARNLHQQNGSALVPPLALLPRQSSGAEAILLNLFGSVTSGTRKRGILEDAHGSGLIVRQAETLPPKVLELLIEAQAKGAFTARGAKAPSPLKTRLYFICGRTSDILRTLKNGLSTPTVLRVPPLRERLDDLPILVSYLLEAQRKRGQEGCMVVNAAAMAGLLRHEWPGNVTELKLALEYASLRAMAEGADMIEPQHLPVATKAKDTSPPRWDMDYQRAKADIRLIDAAIQELKSPTQERLADFLKAGVASTLQRNTKRALNRFPELAECYPSVPQFFKIKIPAPD